MGGRRDYTRWDYDDETEITTEEHLRLDNRSTGCTETFSTTPFPTTPNNMLSSSSPIQSRRGVCNRTWKMSIKEKAQIFVLLAGVLLVGFILGIGVGVRDMGVVLPKSSKHSKHFSEIDEPVSHEHVHDLNLHEFLEKITANNIRDNLINFTKEEHRAGTEAGHKMAMSIRDLWRSFGLSVKMSKHKALLTKTESCNYVEVLNKNGSVLFTTLQVGYDVKTPNSGPFVAFSSAADLNGTLLYGHYGRLGDFHGLRLQKSRIPMNGSIICIIRFSNLHPSNVASNAIKFGCKGLIFYPDPEEFGPLMPSDATRWVSLSKVGQVHEFQKLKGNWSIPSHTISAKDAVNLFKAMEGTEKAPKEWEGGLVNTTYYVGGYNPERGGTARLRTFNEAKMSNVVTVVAAIPGTTESDRYIILGCSHDSLGGNAGDPGIGLALSTELLRAFSLSLAAGWKPRRSIMIISFDANLFAASGLYHWLQEHHFEIANRAVAFIDMTRTLKGNQSLEVQSSPLLKEVARKAINKIKHSGSNTFLDFQNVHWSSVVSGDEISFAFLGLGIPFIRVCISNAPKGYDYPMLNTQFDTYENFVKHVDPSFKASEALGRIISEIILLLADSSALPITLHDYVKDIRKEFDHFTAEYHDDFQKANLSYGSFQAAVMHLQVTSDNFMSHTKNHTPGKHVPHHRKIRREAMEHRILNDKLISFEKALLARNSDSNDGFKHQIIGEAGSNVSPGIPSLRKETSPQEEEKKSHLVNKSSNITTFVKKKNLHPNRVFSSVHFPSQAHFFPKLREILECGRGCENGLNEGDGCPSSELFLFTQGIHGESMKNSTHHCMQWRGIAAKRLSSLVRSLDDVSAIIQSPLVPLAHE